MEKKKKPYTIRTGIDNSRKYSIPTWILRKHRIVNNRARLLCLTSGGVSLSVCPVSFIATGLFIVFTRYSEESRIRSRR